MPETAREYSVLSIGNLNHPEDIGYTEYDIFWIFLECHCVVWEKIKARLEILEITLYIIFSEQADLYKCKHHVQYRSYNKP